MRCGKSTCQLACAHQCTTTCGIYFATVSCSVPGGASRTSCSNEPNGKVAVNAASANGCLVSVYDLLVCESSVYFLLLLSVFELYHHMSFRCSSFHMRSRFTAQPLISVCPIWLSSIAYLAAGRVREVVRSDRFSRLSLNCPWVWSGSPCEFQNDPWFAAAC